MRRSIRVARNVGVVIRVCDKDRPIPTVELDRRMEFEMPFVEMLGVKAKDASENRRGAGQRIEIIQLGRSRIDDFANDRRLAGVVAV